MKIEKRMVVKMFIKNPLSIKRKTINVNDDTRKYLGDMGYMPVAKDGDLWVFISNKDILSLLDKYHKGGE
ncbi:hypothetical protein DW272_01635 [Blautia obeum]|uniref:Uncharacterized protein n=2 Tax=Blautia obeum TaxID=40520 RepID=A0A414SK23_9FIRM|nr:hypothetical protein DW272_01635 [Blautia obeum]